MDISALEISAGDFSDTITINMQKEMIICSCRTLSHSVEGLYDQIKERIRQRRNNLKMICKVMLFPWKNSQCGLLFIGRHYIDIDLKRLKNLDNKRKVPHPRGCSTF